MKTQLHLAIAMLFLSAASQAYDGSPDPSFGSGGLVQLPFQANDAGIDDVADVLTLPNGDVMVVGTTQTQGRAALTVAKLTLDGTPFAQYGTDGIATVSPQGETRNVHARAAALQDDGRLVVTGVVETDQFGLDGNLDIMVCQFLPDGMLDSAFGGVHTGYAGCEDFAFDKGGNLQDVPRDVITDPLGRILIVGHSVCFGDRYSALAMRLMDDGTFDTTFIGQDDSLNITADGWSIFPDPDNLQEFVATSYAAAVRRPTGQLIFAMEFWADAGPVEDATQNNFVVWPAAQDGFGFTTYPFTFPDADQRQNRVAAMSLDGDRLLLAGSAEVVAGQHSAAVVALDTSNNYIEDPGFGDQGYFVDKLCECADTRVAAMAMRDDGRILLASTAQTNKPRMLVTRLLPDGTPDALFGLNGGGTTLLLLDDTKAEKSARGIALQQDQAIIAGQVLKDNSAAFAVLRVTGHRIFRDAFE